MSAGGARAEQIWFMDNTRTNNKKPHYIKFTTTNWGENEYIFETEPILYCKDAGIDLLVQHKIVAYMKYNNIRGKDQKFIYYDNNMKEILHNDSALEHGTFELPQSPQKQ